MSQGLERGCRGGPARGLRFPKGRRGKPGGSASQTADGQARKLPATRRPPNLGMAPPPEVNLIKSGRLSNCDRGWKWDREGARGDPAWGRIRLPSIFVLPVSPAL